MANQISPEGWKLVKLSDLGEVNRGRSRHRPRYAEHLYGGPYPFIQTGDIRESGGRITKFQQTYSEAGLAQSRLWPVGTMCITIAANIAETALLTFPACFPDSVVGFIGDPAKCDNRFVEYMFRHLKAKIQHEASGSVQDNINLETLEKLRFPIPSVAEQRAIANVLGNLDDKLELNHQMNETLEAMARSLFRSWFVDFDPVRAKADGRKPDGLDAATAKLFPDKFEDSSLGPVPKGWRVVSLGEHVEVAKGLSYKGEGLAEAGMALHNLNSVYEGGGYKHEGIKHYVGDYRPCHIIRAGDVIVTNTEQGHDHLLIGYSALIPKRYGDLGLFSHHTYRVRPLPESPLTPPFIHHLLLTSRFRGEVIGFTNGTTVNMLPAEGLKRPRLVLPPAELIRCFTDFVTPLIDKAESNFEESRSLTVTRDALLPKLLSGEVGVR